MGADEIRALTDNELTDPPPLATFWDVHVRYRGYDMETLPYEHDLLKAGDVLGRGDTPAWQGPTVKITKILQPRDRTPGEALSEALDPAPASYVERADELAAD